MQKVKKSEHCECCQGSKFECPCNGPECPECGKCEEHCDCECRSLAGITRERSGRAAKCGIDRIR